MSGPRAQEHWQRLGAARVRAFDFAPDGQPRATAVVVPGLGLPRYTWPAARALARRGVRCVVLDVFADRRPSRVTPSVLATGAAAAHWVDASGIDGPLVLVGHSTGAQSALEAALRLQSRRAGLSLVLAGLTFQPVHRTLAGLLRGTATAYLRDTPRDLVVLPDLAHARSDVVKLVRSAQRDRPEARVTALRVPLTLTAGRHDTFAPQGWMREVAQASGGPSAHVVTLPGSHNNLFRYPEEFAAVVSQGCHAADVGRGQGSVHPRRKELR